MDNESDLLQENVGDENTLNGNSFRNENDDAEVGLDDILLEEGAEEIEQNGGEIDEKWESVEIREHFEFREVVEESQRERVLETEEEESKDFPEEIKSTESLEEESGTSSLFKSPELIGGNGDSNVGIADVENAREKEAVQIENEDNVKNESEELNEEENRDVELFLTTQAILKTDENEKDDEFDDITTVENRGERSPSIERTESFEKAKKDQVRQTLRTTAPKRWHHQEYDPSTLSFASTEVSTVPAERVALEHINSPQVIIQAQETVSEMDDQPSAECGVVIRMSGDVEDLIHNVSDEDLKKVMFDLSPKHSDILKEPTRKYQDIDFIEAMQHFKNANVLEKHKSAVHNLNRLTGWRALKRRFLTQKLHRDLVSERDFLLSIAQCQFEDNSMAHHRILQTIYRRLTQTDYDCARFGPHWECIGFQGSDPATDLRSSGMLSLVMLIYMLTSSQLTRLTRNIYQLSIEWEQNFPFCLMSINMTRIVMQALKDGLLNKICNQNGSVVNVCHSLYVAAYLHMYEIWRDGDKTIVDSGAVLKEVEKFVCKNAKTALRNLGEYMEGPQTVTETKVAVQAFTEMMEMADKVAG